MNCSSRRLTFWMLTFCLMLTIGILPVLAQSSSGNSTAAPTTTTAPSTMTKASGATSAQEIAAAKASGKVWVNTESGVYHKSGRWYGKTKSGKFMTEAEAKAAGYKEAHR